MKKLKIALVDLIGLVYNGDTLNHQGLGGSESSVIYMSKELAKLNFDVTVYNSCEDTNTFPGVFNGVTYKPLHSLVNENISYDIFISSRSVIPFLPEYQFKLFKTNLPSNIFQNLQKNSNYKILWMHDTFCQGDEYLEDLVVENKINEIFTLSDFHTNYITTCSHGRKRNFEVLKNKIFMTRNGINVYHEYTDISQKDPNLFVYNASATKGLIPLLENCWPTIKNHLPKAKLKVIGGYYRFRDNAEPDSQEKTIKNLMTRSDLKKLDVEFTGVITQKEIADIYQKASLFLYPGLFPETFGISTLESLRYKTPLVTTRFGALEETALNQACYLIDYAIEPNSLFPDINKNTQYKKFIETTLNAVQNTYLLQQKRNYCDIINDICTWDTIALQWKQHLYRKLGLYLDIDEHIRANWVNYQVQKVFSRRFSNKIDQIPLKSNFEQKISIITPFFNSQDYIETTIDSIASQDYKNWHCYLIDDHSTDNSNKIVKEKINSLSKNIREKFSIIENSSNQGALKNQVTTIKKYCNNDDIIVLLDGDDSLKNDPYIFELLNSTYHQGYEFTYGSCWSLADNIPLIAQDYPEHIKQTKKFRDFHFNWILPYTHLRTFRKKLINDIPEDIFKNDKNEWLRAGGDVTLFYETIERANPTKIKAIKEILVNYNDKNPLNDYKINNNEQTANLKRALKKKMKKILIAIPTAKYIESETFKSIYDLEIPEGYKVEFQFFHGYVIDQIRNLIADWVVKGYDYLFSVDSDIILPKNALKKLLEHDRDIVSGIYRQRKDQQIIEIYGHTESGGVSNIPFHLLENKGVVRIAACGFGCVLVKKQVLEKVGYPQFEYYSALDHKNTVSEDVDFCMKAINKGFKVWADTDLICDHIGSRVFSINRSSQKQQTIQERLVELSNQELIPKPHYDYLNYLNNSGVKPKVIYDIGAAVLHWTKLAKKVWPDSKFIAFEAMPEVDFLFKQYDIDYHLGVLSDSDNRVVEFYQNTWHPGGNSYYRENVEVNPQANEYFTNDMKRNMIAKTLDTVVSEKNFPLPDLIKIDVQGSELDIIKGAKNILSQCPHLIVELQSVEYNKNAPLKDKVINYLSSIGFELITKESFCNNGPDGDYYFRKRGA